MGYTSFPAFLFACLILIALTSARDFGYSPEDLLSENRTLSLYESWLAKHNKAYTLAEEKQHRYEIFRDNLRYIDEVNQQNLSYWLGLTKFADVSNDEFKSRFPTNMSTQPRVPGEILRYETLADLPKSLDWRTKGAVTPVKDKGRCVSSWSFGTTGVIESINQIVTGKLVSLSEQMLLDCCTDGDNYGCTGGYVASAFNCIISNGGMDTESDYPYQQEQRQCDQKKFAKKVVSIDGWKYINSTVDALLQTVVRQPVSVGFCGTEPVVQHYKGGVLSGTCDWLMNHYLLIVGYGSDGGKDYVIGKNSWGTQWGEDGYIRLDRNVGGKGQCGIYACMAIPSMKKGN